MANSKRQIVNGTLILLLAIGYTLSTTTPARAVEVHIVPTPTGSCPDSISTCKLGYCFETEAAKGISSETQAKQISSIPCNYTLDDLVQAGVNVANFIFGITGSLMLLFFVYAGHQFRTSMGNPEKINEAKATLTSAFIGVIIILAASILVRFIGEIIGAQFGGEVHLEKTVIPQ